MSNWEKFDDVAKEFGASRKSEFFKFPIGTTRVRILSDIQPVMKYKDFKSGLTFTCWGKEHGCPFPPEGDSDNKYVQFLAWGINRETKQVVIFDLPYGVCKKINSLKELPDFDFEGIPDFDIYVKKEKTGEASMNVRYDITPSSNRTPLSADEQKEYASKKTLQEIVEKMKQKSKESYEAFLAKKTSPEASPSFEIPEGDEADEQS